MKNLILIITMFFGFIALNPMTAQNTKVTKNSNTKLEVEKMATPANGDAIHQVELKNTTEAKTKRQDEAKVNHNEMKVKGKFNNQRKSVNSITTQVEAEKPQNVEKTKPGGKVYQKNASEGNAKYKKGELKPNVPASDNKAKLEVPKTQEKTK